MQPDIENKNEASGKNGTEENQRSTVNEENEKIVFRYNRERRLSQASPQVQWLAKRASGKKSGFFSIMFSTRASRLLFASIFAVALYFIVSPLFEAKASNKGNIGNASYSVEALAFEGRILIAIVRKGGGNDTENLIVMAGIIGERVSRKEFPVGSSVDAVYRISLDTSNTLPEKVAIKLITANDSLDLIVPIH